MPRQSRRTKKSPSKPQFYLGLDLSLTGSGVVLLDKTAKVVVASTLKNNLKGEKRLAYIRDNIIALIDKYKPVSICIEGYATNSKYGREIAGELAGVVKLMLYERGYSFYLVAPKRLKKFIIGGGTAEKSKIMMIVFKKWGFEADDDNQADAYGLAQLARCTKFRPAFQSLTKPQKEAVQDTMNPPDDKKKKKGK